MWMLRSTEHINDLREVWVNRRNITWYCLPCIPAFNHDLPCTHP